MSIYLCGIGVLLLLNIQQSFGIQDTAGVIRQLGKHADHRIRPQDMADAVQVSVSIRINSLYGISADSNEIMMDIYFRKHWNDPRMTYTDGPSTVILTPEVASKTLWMPDLFFSNAKEVNMHETLKPNYGARVNEKGDIKLSARMTLKIHCPMSLHKFPMDAQDCPINIESYLHSRESMNLTWKDNGVSLSSDIGNSGVFTVDQDVQTTVTNEILSTGTYQRLEFRVKLKRSSTHYVILTYIPSFLLVILSCLLFWMPSRALLERSLFSVFLLLSHVIIMVSCLYSAPQVGYIKSLDVWVGSCFVFLFVCCFQVICLSLLSKSTVSQKQDQFELIDDQSSRASEDTRKEVSAGILKPETLSKMDLALCIMYPIAFAVFNIVYWAYTL